MTITRKNAGSGHSYAIDGTKTVGVTTIIGAVLNKPALVGWAGNTTAAYAVDHWTELAELPLSKRLERLKKARYEDRDEAARRGSEVHALAERHMAGEEVEIPEAIDGHVASYEKFVADWDPQALVIEGVVAHRGIPYCGTFDLVARLADGHTYLLDYKTSRSGIYSEVALQLAAYRYAETYLDSTGAEQPMESLGITRTAALHLTSDGYRFHPIQAGEAQFLVFRHLAWIYNRMEKNRFGGVELPESWVGSEMAPQVIA